MEKTKIKMLEIIVDFPVPISVFIFWVISSIFIGILFEKLFDSGYFLPLMFGSATMAFIITAIINILRNVFVSWNYELSFYLHKYLELDKRKKTLTEKRIKKAYSMSRMKDEVEKRPVKELSPIRRILIKNLEE